MKHALLPLFISLFILAGCATTQPGSSSNLPELISMTSLPQISAVYPMGGLKLNVLFHVRDDGTVEEVKLLKSSGDPDWDKAAIDSMKLWRFTALHEESPDQGRWIRTTVILQIQEPTVLTLAEINTNSFEEADSLYALLQGGSDFESLCKQEAPGSSGHQGKFLGAVDIARYPNHVRNALRNLGVNEVTKPLRIGNKFLLFKRYKPAGMEEVK